MALPPATVHNATFRTLVRQYMYALATDSNTRWILTIFLRAIALCRTRAPPQGMLHAGTSIMTMVAVLKKEAWVIFPLELRRATGNQVDSPVRPSRNMIFMETDV